MNIGERSGVTYRFSTPISSITLSPDQRRATGVQLASGETLTADIVICNADLVYAYNTLLPPTARGRALLTRQASCSSISFYWALSRKVPELQAHNIFLADEYRDSFDSIFKRQSLPDQPSFYVNVPSRVDPSAAPADTDAVVVLCPVGHLIGSDKTPTGAGSSAEGLDPQDWDALIARARSAVLDTISTRIGVDLAPLIKHESLNTPTSWRDIFNLDRGAILGLSHSFFNVLAFRPSTRHPSAKGLYFVGASTHPGTGVPIVLAGSRITSEQILEDLGMAKPWGVAATVRDREKSKDTRAGGLDEVQVRPLASWFHVAVLLLALFLVWVGFPRESLSLSNIMPFLQ